MQVIDDVCLGHGPPHGVGDRALANDRRRRVTAPAAFAALLIIENDECSASCATLSQARDGVEGGLPIIDNHGLRYFTEQSIEGRFVSFRRAYRFRRGSGAGNHFQNRASDVFVLRFERGEECAQRIDFVGGLRDAIARAGQRFAHRITPLCQVVTMCYGIVGAMLRVDERLLSRSQRRFLLAERHLREVAAVRGAPRRFLQLAEIELAFLDRHFDLMHLVPRFGNLGDGLHQFLACIRE